MKLLCCVKCNEVFSLGFKYKQCSGEHGGGMYVDDINARFWGAKRDIIPIGFANYSFSEAARAQYQVGDLAKTMHYGGELVSPGRDFDAFIMPDATPSITRYESKEEYYKAGGDI